MSHKWRNFIVFALLPSLFYLAFFIFYSYSRFAHFSDSFFSDAGDGLQNAWNFWWTNKAITQGQNLWFTNYLHFPHGTTLLGHTLNLANALPAVLLLKIFSLTQTYNIIITATFILTGLTTFHLCYSISKSYLASIIGGFAFTFSSYHFAHSYGHTNLATLQWMPLFLLYWWHFLRSPSLKLSILCSLALLLVLASDLYYLLFSILAALIMTGFTLAKGRFIFNKTSAKSLTLMIVLGLILITPLPLALIRANNADPLIGAHNPSDYGLDIPSAVIPGQVWRFASLTQKYWANNPLGIIEGSVSIGLGIIGGLIFSLIYLKKFNDEQAFDLRVWLTIALIFFLLSLGPNLHASGQTMVNWPMPYAPATTVLPFLALAGVPVRMIVMTMLAGAVILSVILSKLKPVLPAHAALLLVVFILIFLESWPAPLPLTSAKIPDYVQKLRNLPEGGVIDKANNRAYMLYYQTVHEKPLLRGYIARVPKSVDEKGAALNGMYDNKHYAQLFNDFGFRYVILNKPDETLSLPSPLYADEEAVIYDLKNAQQNAQP